jgi:hypothetical protein
MTCVHMFLNTPVSWLTRDAKSLQFLSWREIKDNSITPSSRLVLTVEWYQIHINLKSCNWKKLKILTPKWTHSFGVIDIYTTTFIQSLRLSPDPPLSMASRFPCFSKLSTHVWLYQYVLINVNKYHMRIISKENHTFSSLLLFPIEAYSSDKDRDFGV